MSIFRTRGLGCVRRFALHAGPSSSILDDDQLHTLLPGLSTITNAASRLPAHVEIDNSNNEDNALCILIFGGAEEMVSRRRFGVTLSKLEKLSVVEAGLIANSPS